MIDVKVLENGNVKLSIPMSFRNCSGRKRIVTPETEQSLAEPLLINLARAFRWQTLIDAGHFSNVNELANAIGKDSADGGRGVAAWNAPVFGEDFGCPLAHYGHHLQRYFPKPIFGNHFTVKCENGDLTFCRF